MTALTLILSLTLPAHAGAYLTSVGTTTEIGEGGNWGRLFTRDEGGYWFFVAGAGDYYRQILDDDYNIVTGSREGLTGEDFLVDHALTQCPDGTWLHVASANLDADDDSAYLYHYDTDFTLLSTETIAERDDTHDYNDAPVICTGDFNGSPFQPYLTKGDTSSTGPFYWYDSDYALVGTLDFVAYPPVGGSSIIQEADGTIAWIRSYSMSDALTIERYTDPSTTGPTTTELDLISSDEAYVGDYLSEEITTYWPQSVIAVGDYYLVAHLGHSPDIDWISDTGNVYVEVFDSDWAWVDGIRVTDYKGGSAAGQPFLHWTEGSETLQVLYSVDVQPTLTEVALNADALGFTVSEHYAPTADAGPDQDAIVGDLVTLDGSGSSDDGTITYEWSFTDIPSGSSLTDASLSDETAAVTTFTPDVPGLYRLDLVVTDDIGLSDTDEALINVAPDEGGGDTGAGDGGALDGGSPDGGFGDGGTPDGGSADGGATDGGSADGGASDGGATDGGSADGGSADGGSADGGSADGGSADGGSADGGSADGGSADGGATDGGATDGGSTDGGATDDGGADGGASGDGGSTDGGKDGCSAVGSAPAGLSLLLLPLIAVGRRRRRG